MRTIEHTLDIPADPTTVWQVLTDTAAYPQWNPFITRLEGELHPGRRLSVTISPGDRSMTFKPVVLDAEPGRLLRWRGRLGVRGVFDGTHEFHLEATGAGGTRFTQRETFSGVLVPLMAGVLEQTANGFAAMNEALRERATSGGR
jgi:hypothetical protein